MANESGSDGNSVAAESGSDGNSVAAESGSDDNSAAAESGSDDNSAAAESGSSNKQRMRVKPATQQLRALKPKELSQYQAELAFWHSSLGKTRQ